MRKYRLFIYTKFGNKKRYHIEVESKEELRTLLDSDVFYGRCSETQMVFSIPSENIDVMEMQEVPE